VVFVVFVSVRTVHGTSVYIVVTAQLTNTFRLVVLLYQPPVVLFV
jgi:hypothetical protein